MPSYLKEYSIKSPLYGVLAAVVLLLGVLAYYNWVIALVGLLILAGLFYLTLRMVEKKQRKTEEYITTLSYRLKKVGEEALLEMPIGIMLFNEDYYIEWTNPFLASCFSEDSLAGRSLYDVADSIVPLIKQEIETETLTLHDRKFKVVHKRDERLLYFFDVTEQVEIEKLYEDERTAIAIILLDNYDDLTQGMDDQRKSSINSLVTSLLDKWARDNGVFFKRVSSERFIAVFNEHILQQLEKGKFSILDEIRETTAKQNVPLTLSIGVGSAVSSLPELGTLAQSSLDLALGRGGDQVAIKQANGKVKFYGGKTNPMEKRTRVRARVISHALKDIVLDSDKVIVMGHKNPDMDAIGSAIGILKVAQMNEREGYIVINTQQLDSSVLRLMEEIKNKEELYARFITPDDAFEMITDETLLVVVDTHKPSMVIEERLLNRIDKVVVIDHHRRGEEFIKNSLLVYMEPYASSTAELVTELLEYQPKRSKIDMLESTALLAGIIVDTKSFTLRTGSRTFDAASYLRAHGADTVLVQKFLKEDVDTYIKRSKLIEEVIFYKKGIAIAAAKTDQVHNQVLIAQAADTLLTMDGVVASFVMAKRSDDTVGISARSLGDINVQVIMEMLNGGGHLTNAATQQVCSIDEAESRLKAAIDEYLEGGHKE
ncbi:DHH family phosphoesterase [Peribacillus simplex]|uniref:Cyclic-di-AMP phosphodiesterase n=1 Tax=Peribacillus simplex TaxID=1478 RepID=A0A9X8ZJH6_9BACI|nr:MULTISPECIES: DHH family phosphoesterase [Bacillaceae]TDL87177.1 DHH family phosphoesterase [Vibrio vulnificus]MCT4479798.1 DHH family phosphoesterase [Peribacillus frigoritolerans]PKF88505.1 DHH family phosphoesterase [Bacillus sp. BA3]TKH00870.1 DHH family phosphoesterase [Peribacillus simplex]TKH13323.1 DHH family phosphoesterase [Peribacillus simplex]